MLGRAPGATHEVRIAAAGQVALDRAGSEAPPRPGWQTRPLRYQPALDGLRAVAVALVVAYHLGYSGVAGGYIGVEVFFVLSGWLVCALLMNEHQRTGAVALGAFWLRRARRLLPAMVTVTVATVAVAGAIRPERLAELRTHGIAALGYHLNWRLVADHESYFESAVGPSALEHLWSLSIEEQFYLAFPLLCGLVLTRVARKWAVGMALGGALAATVLRLALHEPGGDPSRVYFGTDTRAAGLLLGVALGLFWTPNRLRWHDDPRFVAVLDGVAAAAATVLAWYAVLLDETQAVAFRSGFTAVQLATLALIAVAVYPAPSRTRRWLSAPLLRWVGQRSYGIYLIHWPVIVFVSRAPGQQPESRLGVALQVALILGLAGLSYRFVEEPIRRRGLVAVAGQVREHVVALAAGGPLARGALALACVVTVGMTVDVSHDLVTATTPEAPQPEAAVIAPVAAAPSASSATSVTTVTTVAPDPAAPAPAAPAPTGPTYLPVTAIGDSVLVGAAQSLAARMGPAFAVDAAVGRQMPDAVALIGDLAARGELRPVVLLHLGNNGPFTAEQIDAVFAAVGPERTVLLVNVLVPRRWEGEVNDQLAAATGRHPNAVLVDWRSLVTSEPGLTRDDGYHLSASGAERYADLVVGQVPTA